MQPSNQFHMWTLSLKTSQMTKPPMRVTVWMGVRSRVMQQAQLVWQDSLIMCDPMVLVICIFITYWIYIICFNTWVEFREWHWELESVIGLHRKVTPTPATGWLMPLCKGDNKDVLRAYSAQPGVIQQLDHMCHLLLPIAITVCVPSMSSSWQGVGIWCVSGGCAVGSRWSIRSHLGIQGYPAKSRGK